MVTLLRSPLRGARADGLEQLALGLGRDPAAANGEPNGPRDSSQGMREQCKLSRGKLLTDLVSGEEHEAIAREQHGARSDQ